MLISLSNPLISWKFSARNISFVLLSHVKRLPRRTRAPKAKPAPTPLIILPTHLSTKLTLAGSHYGATPAYLRYPKALKVRRVLSRPHHGKSVQPTRGARWRSASALLARSQRARSSGLRRTDSSAATGAYFSRELLLLSALDRHISADISGILNSRTTPYFRKNFRKDLVVCMSLFKTFLSPLAHSCGRYNVDCRHVLTSSVISPAPWKLSSDTS